MGMQESSKSILLFIVTNFMGGFRMPQFFGGRPGFGGFRDGRSQFSSGQGNTADKETEKPIATGEDSLFPDNCGRDDNNKGKLCFPDGLLCQNSKIRPISSLIIIRILFFIGE